MKIKPLYDKVLVKRLEPKEELRGGLVIPDTAKEKSMQAEVVEVGEGEIMKDGSIRPLKVKKGDKVFIGKYSGTEVKMPGKDEEYVLIEENQILAIFE